MKSRKVIAVVVLSSMLIGAKFLVSNSKTKSAFNNDLSESSSTTREIVQASSMNIKQVYKIPGIEIVPLKNGSYVVISHGINDQQL